MGAGIPSNKTRVDESAVENFPSLPAEFSARIEGPMFEPNTVTIKPGETAPPLNVAALTTPPALMAGLVMVKVAVTTGRLPTITCTVEGPAWVPSVTVVDARPVPSVTTVVAPTVALVGLNCTVTPPSASKLLFVSCNSTNSGWVRSAPARPLCLSPETIATEFGCAPLRTFMWKV